MCLGNGYVTFNSSMHHCHYLFLKTIVLPARTCFLPAVILSCKCRLVVVSETAFASVYKAHNTVAFKSLSGKTTSKTNLTLLPQYVCAGEPGDQASSLDEVYHWATKSLVSWSQTLHESLAPQHSTKSYKHFLNFQCYVHKGMQLKWPKHDWSNPNLFTVTWFTSGYSLTCIQTRFLFPPQERALVWGYSWCFMDCCGMKYTDSLLAIMQIKY